MRMRLILTAAVLAVSAAACSDGGPAAPEMRTGTPRAEHHGNSGPGNGGAPGNFDPAPPPPANNAGPATNADPPPPDTTSKNGRGPFMGSGG